MAAAEKPFSQRQSSPNEFTTDRRNRYVHIHDNMFGINGKLLIYHLIIFTVYVNNVERWQCCSDRCSTFSMAKKFLRALCGAHDVWSSFAFTLYKYLMLCISMCYMPIVNIYIYIYKSIKFVPKPE